MVYDYHEDSRKSMSTFAVNVVSAWRKPSDRSAGDVAGFDSVFRVFVVNRL